MTPTMKGKGAVSGKSKKVFHMGERSSARLEMHGVPKGGYLTVNAMDFCDPVLADLDSPSSTDANIDEANDARMLEETKLPRPTLSGAMEVWGSGAVCFYGIDAVGSLMSGPRPFRFDVSWLDNLEVVELIKKTRLHSVEVGSTDFQLHKKSVKHKLIGWKKDNKFDLKAKIDGVLVDIELLDLNALSYGVLTKQMVVERGVKLKELEDLGRSEKFYCKQRSMNKWLNAGDLNTKFLRAIASARRRQNDISGLNIPGLDLEDNSVIEVGVISHFKKAFTKEVVMTLTFLNVPSRMLNEERSVFLEGAITIQELHHVVFALPGDKASGPDGFPLVFFQRFWNIIKDDLLAVVREFMIRGQIFKGINSTFLAWIPKKSVISELSDIRSISLLISVYKIIAKILAERLKEVLHLFYTIGFYLGSSNY
ncbi:uncharacterized protein LOC110007559 [Amborella trichopoda]|uniref:uncharacterized protein LOC110007559 n=1 Tax=Amborella trichopoda TaxID=13333 RepID=UPI0009BDB448|nr:uncharacterized protein LOC110007559 [Amborella trichopoda]|eukprot:XP_020524781.1 uncharacterized protein LOC110007559 [Amborella trichopoda]